MKRVLLIIGALLLGLTGAAQMQGRGSVRHTQSDGRIVSYVAIGVRPNIYAQTLDGYTLWHTATGDIVYATTDSTGQMVPSEVLAADQHTAEEEAFLGTLPKGLRFLDLPSPLMAGHLLGGDHFPHTATESDSLLVILVQFQDVQFTNPVVTFDSLFSQPGYDGTGSFKDYYRDQSGGVFNPGVRVVGPVTMPQNKDYYNQTSWMGSTAQDMVRLAITQSDQQVDYSHYDNDNDGVVDAVLIFYAGVRPADKTQGLWPKRSTITSAGAHDGKSFASYAIFDEGESGMPTIGTVCHEFGHCLGLPDLYDVAHDGTDEEQGRTPGEFSLMASGGGNGNGKLPPNLSVLEKSLLGWGAQFDTLQPGDSISLRAIGTANDRAWYLPIDGNEFYAFEVRSGANHWDAGIGMGEGGLIVYHGKESKLNTTSNSVINCTVGDEGWYVVNSHEYEVPFGGSNPSSFTPLSFAKPMKNDGTVVDSIWIANIRWTSDSTMAFDYSKSRFNRVVVEDITITGIIDSNFIAYAHIISYIDTLLAKGIVYAATPESCTMEQGTVIYDNNIGDDTMITADLTSIQPGKYWLRTFVSDGSGITMSDPKMIITPLIHVNGIYAYDWFSTPNGRYRYVADVTMAPHCQQYYTSYGIDHKYNRDGYIQSRYEESGHVWLNMTQFDTLGGYVVLTAIGTENDTVSYRIDLNNNIVHYVPNYRYLYMGQHFTDACMYNGIPRATLRISSDGVGTDYVVVKMATADFDRVLNYYEPQNRDTTTNNQRLDITRNHSLYNHLINNYTTVSFGGDSVINNITLATGDTTMVLIGRNASDNLRYFQEMDKPTHHDGVAGLADVIYGPHGPRYITDSVLRIITYSHHCNMLYGTVEELVALGVTDTASAAAYCIAHPNDVVRYEGYYMIPQTLENIVTTLHGQVGPTYQIYLVPFDSHGNRGDVESETFTFVDSVWAIKPGLGASYEDTTWWHLQSGHLSWRWRRDWINSLECDSVYIGTFRAGEIEEIMWSEGLNQKQVMQRLKEQGRLSTSYYMTTDTLQEDMTYEACVWSVLTNTVGRWRDTILERRTFSTQLPDWIKHPQCKVTQLNGGTFEEGYSFPNISVSVNELAAFFHVIYGSVEELADRGINNSEQAKAYCWEHRSTLTAYKSWLDVYFFSETNSTSVNSYNGGRTEYHTRILSSDSTYRVFVIPYTADSLAGDVRAIAFRPGQTHYYENTTVTDPASEITAQSATLNGHLSKWPFELRDDDDPSIGRTYTGFLWKQTGAADYDTVLAVLIDTSFSITLTGLTHNTTYQFKAFNDWNGRYYTGVWGTLDQYSGTELTFTTPNCTTSVTIDTTICYNTYYNGQQYTSNQILQRHVTMASGCDSVMTIRLTVLPQRIGYDTTVLCYGEPYNGTSRYTSTTVTETISEAGRCDSTLRVYLRVLPQRIGYDTVVLCYGEEYDGTARYSSVTVSETVTEPNQCDSTIRHRLQVLPQNKTAFRDTLRDGSYEWAGEVFTEPGQYTHVFTAANGCDSTVTLTLVAEPEPGPIEGIDDVREAQAELSVDGRTIVVTGAEGLAVTVYDVSGRVIATRRDGIRFEVPAAGTYLVQVGERPARRVVVVK